MSPGMHAAADGNAGRMFLQDSGAHPQSQAGARGFLGGKEWLENVGDRLPGDAMAIIRHRDPYTLPPGFPVCPFALPQKDPSSPRGGIGCIADKIREHCLRSPL